MAWKSALRSRGRTDYGNVHRHRSPRRGKGHFLYRLGLLSFLGVVGLFVLLFVIMPIFAIGLPSPDKVSEVSGVSSKIYDRNGVLLYDIYENEKRTPVKFEDIPPYLKQATIAVEDKNFYKHSGFDPIGMARAVVNIAFRGKLQGGSTLTQQLVKNVLLTSERTLPRKIKEFVLAVQIERKYSKDEILTMYLNNAPYGGATRGVESAAETYFGKSAKDLSLVESAVLAGLPQSPSRYSPYSTTPDAYVGRTKTVLKRMKDDRYVTKEQEEEALKQLTEVKFIGKAASFKAPHFVTYVQSILEERYGQAALQSGLKITTTLDWELQEKAQSIVSEEIAKVEGQHITNGAALVVDPQNGQILSMVGSKDFGAEDYDGQVNVTLSKRQPGSAIKPVTYVTGLKKGYTASTLLMDTPTTFPGGENLPKYEPVNYDGKYRGPIQVRYALANSVNIPAVKMLAISGVADMLSTAYDMGIGTLAPTKENLTRFGLSVTLGGGEVRLIDIISAYGAFANGGLKYEPISILKVEDLKGKVLEEYEEKKGEKVLSEAEAFIISDILSDNNARAEIFGTRSLLNVSGKKVAVKTGTTNDQRDNWAIGWAPSVVVGAWVGNNDNTPMKKVASGVSGATPIWNRIIAEALVGKPNVGFEVPSGVVQLEVDKLSGYRSHDGFASRTEYFIKGTEPDEEDPVHVMMKLCKGDGKMATPSQVAGGDYDTREMYVFREEDPTGSEENMWQKGIIEWLDTQSDSKYHPPADYCGSANPINVEFLTPKDHDQVPSGDVEVRADAKSVTDIVEIEITMDNDKKYLLTTKPWKVTFSGVKDGVHTLVAKAKDKNGNASDRKITIGVGVAWNAASP